MRTFLTIKRNQTAPAGEYLSYGTQPVTMSDPHHNDKEFP